MPTRVLLEGRPGVGKTTAARRLATLLRVRGARIAGFTTEEIREGGRRVGFAVETTAGIRGVLAHVNFPGPPRVGRYGVDLATLERVAVPSLAPDGVAIVDELGKMELASDGFRDAVRALFDGEAAVVATVPARRNPFTDALERRGDIELLQVTPANRDALPARLAERLSGS